MDIDHLGNRDFAINFLAEKLRKGTLVLFLGTGASSGASLPSWRTLVERIRSEKGLSNDNLKSDARSLEQAVGEVQRKFFHEDDRDFAELVKNCLYRGVSLDDSLLRDRLLIALGALMMGSRRGSVKRVVTFNFDSVLEWYISLYGFVPKVILQPPVDEGAEDVRIYHPHGFLPLPGLKMDGSDFVMLSQSSINLRAGKPHDEWTVSLRHTLSSGVGLFVGLSEHSFRDVALAPVLTYVGSELKKRRPPRPTGFWILKSEEHGWEDLAQEFLNCNIVPLRISSYDEIPNLLLEVCQRAAEDISSSA
jgi:hypothetical protein